MHTCTTQNERIQPLLPLENSEAPRPPRRKRKPLGETEQREADLKRFWKKVVKRGPAECWEWTSAISHNGYGQFYVAGHHVPPHRWIYQITNGCIIPKGHDACHHCDNRRCVNPSHIFPGTRKENMMDCKNKGRLGSNGGEGHPFAKLTWQKAEEIRAKYKPGMHGRLAREYGVHSGTINDVLKRVTWKRPTAARAAGAGEEGGRA